MPNLRLLALLFAGLLGALDDVSSASAQSKAAPSEAAPTASPKTAPAENKPPEMPDIIFYVAKGEANACGPSCDEWIAADGKIDRGAPQRLRRLLTKLGRRKLPIFFHSPGGSAEGSMELGRLFRNQKMTVSVARTIPQGCDRDKLYEKTCEALKRSGQDLASELDISVTMCNSGCVYALAGGTARVVPPFVKLGIHSVGIFSTGGPPVRGAALAASKHIVNSELQEYLHDMGMDAALFAAANAVPFSSVRFLQRDELARFGIDAREFGESAWHFVSKPTAVILKTYFAKTGNEHAYQNTMVRLSCGNGKAVVLAVAREVGASGATDSAASAVEVAVGGRHLNLPSVATTAGFDLHAVTLSAEFVESINDSGMIEVFAPDADRTGEKAPAVMLALNGFSAAYAKFRPSCNGAVANNLAVGSAIVAALQNQSSAMAGGSRGLPQDQRDAGQNNDRGWVFNPKPAAAMTRSFFAQSENRGATLRLGCGAGGKIEVSITRKSTSSETTGYGYTIRMTVNDWHVDLAASAFTPATDVRRTAVPVESMESIGDRSTLEISAVDPRRGGDARPVANMDMTGFSAAYAELRKACGESSWAKDKL